MFKLPIEKKKFHAYLFLAGLVIAVLLFAIYQNHVQKEILTYAEMLSQYEDRFSQYDYSDFKDSYDVLMERFQDGLDERKLSLLKSCCNDLDELEASVIAANTEQIERKVKKLKKADLSNAYETELKRIGQLQAEIQTRLKEHQFTSVTPLLEEWSTILSNMSFIADNLSIYVNQADSSQYPLVSLYLSIHDIEKDEVPSYLVKNYFYLTETISAETASAKDSSDMEKGAMKEVPCQVDILSMEQLDGNEPLTIAIAADMGETRTEEELHEIRQDIASFLNVVQFDVKDKIELQSVSDTFSVIQEFTTDKEDLVSSLSQLITLDSSSHFYDGLIASLDRLSYMPGAKCLIAFTDGEDAQSTHSWEEVVTLSNQYHIPIYMIGIGNNVSPYVLERMGSRTNGAYRNVNDFSSLETIFESIYEKQKSLYKVEYRSALEEAPLESRVVHVAYQNRLFGGSCDYLYSPYIPETAAPENTTETKME